MWRFGRRRGLNNSQEELEDVEVHEEDGDGHGIAEVAVQLILLDCIAQHEHAPAHHAHAAIGPGLEVKVAPDTRVQLHAPVIVKHQAACAP